MFRRLFWFSLGVYSGYRAADRVRHLSEQADRYVPPRVREEVVGKLRLVSREVRGVVREFTNDATDGRVAG
ncbi:MAG TPA: hypothetical protein VNB24_07295 [Acidimicrobiales bacterium]|nr:hypothetical protein [Acidimicrobiales bacterium]